MNKESFVKKYTEFCKKEGLDPCDVKTIEIFKRESEKQESQESKDKKEKNPELIERQKEIFKKMCEYCGVHNLEYDDCPKRNLFDALDGLIKMVVAKVGQIKITEDVLNLIKMSIDHNDIEEEEDND